MALGPVVAAALTDHSTRSKGLYLDGFDVAKQPGMAGNGFGVPEDSITVVEAGPGGVSSLVFDIDDPQLAITVTRGQEVRYIDLVNDRVIFLGRVQAWAPRPWATGRTIAVRAGGVEAALDWMRVIALSIPAGTAIETAVQSIVAAAVGVGIGLRALAPTGAFGTANGNQATPVGRLNINGVTLGADLILAGETVREAIRKAVAIAVSAGGAFAGSVVNGYCTVDFTLGLRLWNTTPDDYAGLTINDAPAGPIVAADPGLDNDATGVPSAVIVTGAPGTQIVVSDGSGVPGPVASFTDTTLTNNQVAAQAGAAYLAAQAPTQRAQARLEDTTFATNVRAGSIATLTDVQLGAVALPIAIASITKTYHGATEDWQLALGGQAPSLTRQLRRLTRDQLA